MDTSQHRQLARTATLAGALALFAALFLARPAAAQIYSPGPDPRYDLGVVTSVGVDVAVTHAGEKPGLLSSGEFRVTTKGKPMSYFSLRTFYLGWPATRALGLTGANVDRGLSFACALCASVGWNVADVGADQGMLPGHVTLGAHYDWAFLGSEFDFAVPMLGADLGYLGKRGPWEIHPMVSASMVAQSKLDGGRLRLGMYARWRGRWGLSVYGRAELCMGQVSNDSASYEFEGGSVLVGMAWVSREGQ